MSSRITVFLLIVTIIVFLLWLGGCIDIQVSYSPPDLNALLATSTPGPYTPPPTPVNTPQPDPVMVTLPTTEANQTPVSLVIRQDDFRYIPGRNTFDLIVSKYKDNTTVVSLLPQTAASAGVMAPLTFVIFEIRWKDSQTGAYVVDPSLNPRENFDITLFNAYIWQTGASQAFPQFDPDITAYFLLVTGRNPQTVEKMAQAMVSVTCSYFQVNGVPEVPCYTH